MTQESSSSDIQNNIIEEHLPPQNEIVTINKSLRSINDPPRDSQWNKEKAQELARRVISYVLLGQLVVTSLLYTCAIGLNLPWVKVDLDKDFLTLLWTSEVTLVGTVLGFYFGNNSNK
jgi:hypothetical protein